MNRKLLAGLCWGDGWAWDKQGPAVASVAIILPSSLLISSLNGTFDPGTLSTCKD